MTTEVSQLGMPLFFLRNGILQNHATAVEGVRDRSPISLGDAKVYSLN